MADKDSAVLVADVGGTNTRVALARGTAIIAGTTERFRNAEHSGLETVLAEYLSKHRSLPARAAIALAGPVRGETAAMTNLGWSMEASALQRMTGIRSVALLNDLQAQGHALHHLGADHLRMIREGHAGGGTRLVIGLGTGVNAAPVYPAGAGHIVPPAEAGHIHLPQQTDEDRHLARWLTARRGFASVEDVLAGAGLERLFAYHAEQTGGAQARDAGAIMAALAEGDALATRTGRHYVRILAQYTADLALTTLPFGGIYYIGGVARAFTPWMARFGYDAAFTDMGRFSDLVAQFPVALVEDDFAALTGCAAYLAA
ncbi:Glucokinase [Roseibaca ekhonensis]|uniref:Glucokinase n=1 Tax=Roseinatronobacter ekhonensis TaxID=254356 RepID=A0A3B0M800_9RHOB|nr:glucokinase [Roseibaca ekhonensis]SUZ32101.1 Glucokinase [Roseibaca ekhonensis]